MNHLARVIALLVLLASALAGCADPPTRAYVAKASSLLTSDVDWVLLVDGEVTDRGTVRIRADVEQPFNLDVEEGQRVSFTVGVVGTGIAGCTVERVADRAQIVPPVRQEPQIDRAADKSPPALCEFVA